MSAVVFIKSIQKFIFLCVLLRPVQGCMENMGPGPSYDRIDEQEPGPGITIGAKSPNQENV